MDNNEELIKEFDKIEMESYEQMKRERAEEFAIEKDIERNQYIQDTSETLYNYSNPFSQSLLCIENISMSVISDLYTLLNETTLSENYLINNSIDSDGIFIPQEVLNSYPDVVSFIKESSFSLFDVLLNNNFDNKEDDKYDVLSMNTFFKIMSDNQYVISNETSSDIVGLLYLRISNETDKNIVTTFDVLNSFKTLNSLNGGLSLNINNKSIQIHPNKNSCYIMSGDVQRIQHPSNDIVIMFEFNVDFVKVDDTKQKNTYETKEFDSNKKEFIKNFINENTNKGVNYE